MLSIKPVMHTSDEGKLVPVGKVRGRKASLNALIDKIGELGIAPEKQTMFICQADCEDEARWVADQIKARYGTPEVPVSYTHLDWRSRSGRQSADTTVYILCAPVPVRLLRCVPHV